MICNQKENKQIKKYTIFGERHSGTNLIQNLFTTYINLDLTWDHGWKHGIGFANKISLNQAEDVLFVCMVRNPYDWLGGFFKSPQHVPVANTKSWNNFLLNEWYSTNELLLTEIDADRNFVTQDRYKNIFELRQYKINYLRQTIPHIVNNYLLISYEELINNHQKVLSTIIHYFSLSDRFTESIVNVHEKKSYSFNSSVLKIIDNNIDWNTERTIGYFKKAA